MKCYEVDYVIKWQSINIISELINIFKKTMVVLHENIIDKVLTTGCKKIKKRKLNKRQTIFLKKLFNFIKNPYKSRIKKITGRLYNLGFSEKPIKELYELYADQSKTILRRNAAFELARWHANKHDREGAKKCLEILSVAKNGETLPSRLCQIALIEAECQEKIGNSELGKRTIEHAIEQLGPEGDLYITAANFENTLAEKVKWINKVLELYQRSPIYYDDTAGKSSLNSLKHRKNTVGKNYKCNNRPLVSVIVPVYNAENTIGTALDTILSQTYEELEVLVVDDCSTDNTVSVIEEYANKDKRVKLIKAKINRGAYVARNLALGKAKGEFVTTHDADDWSHQEKIEYQVTHLIEHPLVIGNTSEMASVYPGLKFYRGDNPGIIIYRFISSLLFRREPVLKNLGFWDSVRFSSDHEYIRRIKKYFGEDSIVDLSTGPLSLYRQSSDSLTGIIAFGNPGYYMGARKEYYEAQVYYHKKNKDLYYSFPQDKRPFPVPEPMWPEREKLCPSGRRHFDTILVSDFRTNGGSLSSNINVIKAQKKLGMRTGLIQMSNYDLDPERMILHQVRDLIDGDLVQMLVYGEMVSCDLLLILDHQVLQEKQLFIPDITTGDLRVVIKQMPENHISNEKYGFHCIERNQKNLQDYFGKNATWYPIDNKVREALYRFHADELKSINLSDDDWVNIHYGLSE